MHLSVVRASVGPVFARRAVSSFPGRLRQRDRLPPDSRVTPSKDGKRVNDPLSVATTRHQPPPVESRGRRREVDELHWDDKVLRRSGVRREESEEVGGDSDSAKDTDEKPTSSSSSSLDVSATLQAMNADGKNEWIPSRPLGESSRPASAEEEAERKREAAAAEKAKKEEEEGKVQKTSPKSPEETPRGEKVGTKKEEEEEEEEETRFNRDLGEWARMKQPRRIDLDEGKRPPRAAKADHTIKVEGEVEVKKKGGK